MNSKNLFLIGVIGFLIWQAELLWQKITGTEPVPMTPEQQIFYNEQRALRMAMQKAIDSNDFEKVSIYLAEGLPVNARIPDNWQNQYMPKRPLLAYALDKWGVTDEYFSSTPARGWQSVGYGGYYAPDSYFRLREDRAKIVEYLLSQGADLTEHGGSVSNPQLAIDRGYLPLLKAMKKYGWDETAPMWQNPANGTVGLTPLMYMSANYPKYELSKGEPCRRARSRICTRIRFQVIFDWLLESHRDFQEVTSGGHNFLSRGVVGATSENEAIYRINFWQEKGIDRCVRYKDQMSIAEFLLNKGWADAYKLAKCSK